ncbi:hypothetical protein [Nonomuraea sp. NPDC050310]|uniref:hypothetical protein n=1 Tax=unclassified Nonomuraea TaxID=2593643 RepID=UPI0033D141B6
MAILVDRSGPGRKLADWLAEQACLQGLEVDLIDLSVAPAADLGPWLADADAYVVVTPCEVPADRPAVYPADLLEQMLKEIE